ncbi:DUF4266 domain-containing protein [Pseudoduganella namucuonensis]|uniref:DUF4266 domain-containing protein n=1 Tax=Pseudoduganella namucuonensis TaxID=1035707 RepID=A0A1I7KTC1_9BURK|nr:DUF4266 domain-containing protein [Pseudoduganella namucuonensis]SFV00701.1 protein of unknown function [Pseudoduganella namucuonensis]
MTPRTHRRLATLARLAALAAIAWGAAGCGAIKPVQAWEKGHLARPEMLMEGDLLEGRYDEHIYASREAASGGSGVGGGGCGCN